MLPDLRQQQLMMLLAHGCACLRGPRMVLVGAGAVDHGELVNLAEKAFGSIPDETSANSVPQLIAAVRRVACVMSASASCT